MAYIKRKQGSKGAEKPGYTKSLILYYLLNSDDPVSVEDISFYVKDWTRNNLNKPIMQTKGIYRHIKQLEELKLINKNKVGNGYQYDINDVSLDMFERLSNFFADHNTLDFFISSEYFTKNFDSFFSEEFSQYFKEVYRPTTEEQKAWKEASKPILADWLRSVEDKAIAEKMLEIAAKSSQ